VRYAIFLLGCSAPAPAIQADAAADAVVDAAIESAAPRDCSRAAQSRTAPVSLYDALGMDVAALSGAALTQRLDAFLADVRAQGGTPLEDGANRVVFIARGAPPSGPWSVAGAFTNWKAGALPMKNIAGDLWALDTSVPRGAQPYKLLSGALDSGFMEDPLAVNVAWDGIDHQTVGQFNAIAHQSDAPLTKGRIARWRNVNATKLGDARDVFVYFPGAYDDGSCANRPAILFHDGNESLTRGDFASVADAEYAQFPMESAVLAFVALPSQDVRIDQYTFGTQTAKGDLYVDFLVSDLLPRVRALHVCGAQAALGIAGASLGGLISAYAAFEKPNIFGFVGSQSGSFFWNNEALVTHAQTTPKIPVRFYLDHGCPDDNCISNRDMNLALVAKSYDVMHVEDPGAQHDWSFWKARLPRLLGDFRSGQTACD